MQKAGQHFWAIVGRILLIGLCAWIVLGIGWMGMNFPYLQSFGETALYEEISKTFICDEYEGILYPILILFARGIAKIFPIPYHCILYVVQLACAFCAGRFLLGCAGVKKKLWSIGGSLVLLTFPMAMQCHLAVLPSSLVSSFLLLELALGLQIIRGKKTLAVWEFAKVLGCWLLLALLQPEYLYLGAVPVILLFLFGACKAWKKEERSILYCGILMCTFGGMILSVMGLSQTAGYYGRVHKSLNVAMASRCVWPNANKDYEVWPEEVKEYLTWEDALHIDFYADHMERILGRTLEDKVGVEHAEALLGEVASIGWERHRNTVLHDAAWDMAGYIFSPMVVQRQLLGKAYDSYSGRNYDIMRQKAPQLTEYYLNYGSLWFAVGLGLTVLLWLVYWCRRHFAWTMEGVLVLFGWMFTILGIVLYYTLQGAGMMDYKKSLGVTLLWLVWMLVAGHRAVESDCEKGEEC